MCCDYGCVCESVMARTEFMSVRKIPLRRFTVRASWSADAGQLHEEMRAVVLTDRDLHDRAVKAFVAFVRSYSKHEASYIFKLKDLDLIGVAQSYALLRLPKMPELKGLDTSSWTDADVDVRVQRASLGLVANAVHHRTVGDVRLCRQSEGEAKAGSVGQRLCSTIATREAEEACRDESMESEAG